MKRCWIGAAFLLALLILSLGVTWAMEEIHEPIEEDLNQAAALALRGDWRKSERFFFRAQNAWRKWDHFRTCFADHTPVEEVDALFQAAEIYCLTREEADFAAQCRMLAKKAAAVGEAHGLSWWNVL